jgi:putative acetyltransferase
MNIELDDLSRPAIHALLNEHLQNMYELSPPESVHALDLSKLRGARHHLLVGVGR